MSKYLVNKWWTNWLREQFPYFVGTPDLSWGIKESYQERMQEAIGVNIWDYQWYKSDVAAFGYRYLQQTRPYLWVFVPETKLSLLRTFRLEDAEEDIQIIEAIANPKLLPLCLHTWAKPVVIDYFERIQRKVNKDELCPL